MHLSDNIHAIRTDDGTIEVEVVRLHLRFFINKNGSLESQEHGATVDQNQGLGCLYGLANKLVLLDSSGQGDRTALVPYGQVAMRKNGQHTRISVRPPESATIKYLSYSLDPHLQALRGSSGMLCDLYLAYLHAVTGFVLPDPATNRSGTDEALRILRQARMKSTFPLDLETSELLKDIAALTPHRKHYPAHLKVMQVKKWNSSLGQLAQHDDFGPIIQEIVNHSTRFSTFYSISGEKPVNVEIDLGVPHLLERARFRHRQFQCSEFGGSPGYPIAQYSTYSSRDRNQSSERSGCVYEVAALVRDWPASARQCEDLTSRIMRWPHVCTRGLKLGGLTYNELLKLSIQDAWGTLYDMCRASIRRKDSYRLLSVFCTFAFDEKLQLSDIRILLAIAFSDQFRDFPIPNNERSKTDPTLRLCMGKELDRHKIEGILEKYYHSFESSDYGSSRQYLSTAEREDGQRREADYERRKERELAACLGSITSQWPCERRNLPEGLSTQRMNRTAALEECASLFTCWYRNRQFFEFIQEVQNRLKQMRSVSSGGPLVESIPLRPMRGPIRRDPPFQPPTLLELMRPSGTIKIPPDLQPLVCARSRNPQCSYTSNDLGLRSLIHGSFEDTNVHRREYKEDLLQSLDALERTHFSCRPNEIPVTRDILSNYQADLR